MVPPRSRGRGRGRSCPRLPCPCRDPLRNCSCSKLPNLGPTSSAHPAPGSRLPRRRGSTGPFSQPKPPPPNRLPPLPCRHPSPNRPTTSFTYPKPPGGSLVRPSVSYRDAVLMPPAPPLSAKRPRTSTSPGDPSLPDSPPLFLLNPSLRGRCYRCFGNGHRANRCWDPRRCLACMEIGHTAARCGSSRSRSPSPRWGSSHLYFRRLWTLSS